MPTQLPPGPRAPRAVQTLAWWTRTIPLFERCRARYGKRFTLRLLHAPPFVHLCDPAEVKEVFTAPPEVLHPGEGARVLAPVVGLNSVILLDESAHLSQRKLMLPAFHGQRMEALTGVVEEVTAREVESWPLGEPLELHPRLQALTLEVILRAVFGLDPGGRLDTLRDRLNGILEMGARPASMLPFLQRGSAWSDFERRRDEVDGALFELIDERRAAPDGETRDDVLSMLLAARHEDDTPMSHRELRDELMTLLVAGHETTASELAWAFERLARSPRVAVRLGAEIDSGDDEAYLTATVQETLRRRPVLPNAAPRLVMKPVEVGGVRYPAGVCLVANAHLIHHDPVDLRQPLRVSSRALPRRPAGHLHLDPVRGRPAALPRRELRDAGDEGRAARGALARRGQPGTRRRRGQPAPLDNAQPAQRRDDHAARAQPGREPVVLVLERRSVGPEAPDVALGIAHREVA